MDQEFLAWMTIGLGVGLATRRLAPGGDPGGPVLAVLLGIAGALLGGVGGQAARLYGEGALVGYVGAAAGGTALVLFYRLVMRRRRS